MNRKMMGKMLVDLGMTVLLFICMSFQFMEQKNHEIFGAILFAVFIAHHLLNYKWYVNLRKGRYTGSRILSTCIDFIILLAMLALMVSGMRLSGYVFKWMGLNYSLDLARTLHMTSSYGGFLFLGLHIGLHYGMIMGMVGKLAGIKGKNPTRTRILRAAAGVISAYGLYALNKRQFLDYIFGRMHFVMFDYGEPVILFVLDLAAIMALMIGIGYYVQKLLINRSRNKVK